MEIKGCIFVDDPNLAIFRSSLGIYYLEDCQMYQVGRRETETACRKFAND